MNYLLCAHRLVHGGQDTGGGLRPLVAKSCRPSALAALPFRRHRIIGSAFPRRCQRFDGRRKNSCSLAKLARHTTPSPCL